MFANFPTPISHDRDLTKVEKPYENKTVLSSLLAEFGEQLGGDKEFIGVPVEYLTKLVPTETLLTVVRPNRVLEEVFLPDWTRMIKRAADETRLLASYQMEAGTDLSFDLADMEDGFVDIEAYAESVAAIFWGEEPDKTFHHVIHSENLEHARYGYDQLRKFASASGVLDSLEACTTIGNYGLQKSTMETIRQSFILIIESISHAPLLANTMETKPMANMFARLMAFHKEFMVVFNSYEA